MPDLYIWGEHYSSNRVSFIANIYSISKNEGISWLHCALRCFNADRCSAAAGVARFPLTSPRVLFSGVQSKARERRTGELCQQDIRLLITQKRIPAHSLLKDVPVLWVCFVCYVFARLFSVPLLPELCNWLANPAGEAGRIFHYTSLWKELTC